MDDFYVYYEPMANDITKGIIKAVAPNELADMDMEHIRVPPEQGMTFTVGSEPIGLWLVAWDADKGDMSLTKVSSEEINNTEIVFLEEIPRHQKKPQMLITFKDGEFTLLTRGVSISHQNLNMTFFVTRQGDPNILLHHFTVTLYDTMGRRGTTVPCPVELDEFSVFTKRELESYQLKVQR